MMKTAAEQPAQTQVMPGQTGARPVARARMGREQANADFEGLLARQSMIPDMPSEKREEASPDIQPAQQGRATPEALFFALAGGREFGAQPEVAEQPRAPDSGDGDNPSSASDTGMTPAATATPEPAAVPSQPQVVVPNAPVAMKERGKPAEAKPAMGPTVALPTKIDPPDGEIVADPAREPTASADGRATERDAAPSPAQRKLQAIGEAASPKETGASQGPPPVTLIRVAGQETHFAPTPVFLFDDQKLEASGVNASAGLDEPSRVQPQSPIAIKAPSGPLKTLTVQLGSQELGLINATLALKDKMLDLRVDAMRDEAVTSLRENAGRLADTLQSLGFAVDGVIVQKMHQAEASAQAGNGHPMQHGAAGQDGQGQQRDLNGSGFGAEGSSRQSRQVVHDDHLAEQDGNDQANSAGATRNSRDVFL